MPGPLRPGMGLYSPAAMPGQQQLSEADLHALIRDIPDFPKPGIVFKDITPLLADHAALVHVVEALGGPFRDRGITRVVGIESRGFILATPVAMTLGCGVIPMRKPGKLPYQTHSIEYELEYGTDTLEVHVDAVGPGDRVLLIDDVLATGGTMAAAVELVRRCGAEVVAAAFLVDLAFLDGAARLDCPTHHVLRFT